MTSNISNQAAKVDQLVERLNRRAAIAKAAGVSRFSIDHQEWFDLKASLASAEAALTKMREALEPFARFYNDLDKLQLITGGTMPPDSKCIATVAHAGVGPRIELGDFRRASSALSDSGEGEGKQGVTASISQSGGDQCSLATEGVEPSARWQAHHYCAMSTTCEQVGGCLYPQNACSTSPSAANFGE